MHGNLPAFEKMLETEGKCDQYICLGDLVNYGPWSNECVDLAMSLPNSELLMGNHEEAFIDNFYGGSNELVMHFFQKTISSFDRNAAIKSFLPETCFEQFICKHTVDDIYIYPDTQILLKNNYIIGHSHHQFQTCSNSFCLYNAGSVGQNRKFINISNYLISQDGKIEMKSLLFDIRPVIQKMESLGYPSDCINYYKEKPVY